MNQTPSSAIDTSAAAILTELGFETLSTIEGEVKLPAPAEKWAALAQSAIKSIEPYVGGYRLCSSLSIKLYNTALGSTIEEKIVVAEELYSQAIELSRQLSAEQDIVEITSFALSPAVSIPGGANFLRVDVEMDVVSNYKPQI